MRCVFPSVPESVFQYVINMEGFEWRCPDNRELSVSKLLDKLSLAQAELMKKASDFAHDLTERDQRKMLRARKRANSNDKDECPVLPAKRSSSLNVIIEEPMVENIPKTSGPTTSIQEVVTSTAAPATVGFQSTETPPAPALVLEAPAPAFVLEALLPARRVFVSRLKGRNLTSKVIGEHLTSCLADFGPELDFRVEKINLPDDRNYSSFIVHTGQNDDLFEAVINSSTWPFGTIVHEFFPRRSTQPRDQ